MYTMDPAREPEWLYKGDFFFQNVLPNVHIGSLCPVTTRSTFQSQPALPLKVRMFGNEGVFWILDASPPEANFSERRFFLIDEQYVLEHAANLMYHDPDKLLLSENSHLVNCGTAAELMEVFQQKCTEHFVDLENVEIATKVQCHKAGTLLDY